MTITVIVRNNQVEKAMRVLKKKIQKDKTSHQYKLNEKRKIDQKIISQLKNAGVTLKIH